MLSKIIVDSLVFDFEFIVIANGKNQVVIEQIKHSSLFMLLPIMDSYLQAKLERLLVFDQVLQALGILFYE